MELRGAMMALEGLHERWCDAGAVAHSQRKRNLALRRIRFLTEPQ